MTIANRQENVSVSPVGSASLEYLDLNTLRPHPDNPRTHSKNQLRKLAKSIQEFGFRAPVLVDAQNRLICGHARVEAARMLGTARIPALRVDDLTDAQVRGYMVADNRIAELAEWDEELLVENLQILCEHDLDFDPECLGFDYGEMEVRIREAEDAQEDDEEPPPEPTKGTTVSREGDVWILGDGRSGHRVLCADATDTVSYDTLMAENRAALVFTDPPYNVSARHIGRVCAKEHGDFAMASGEMTRDEFTDFLSRVIGHLCAVSQPGSIHYLCMDWRHLRELLDAGHQHYAELKNLCVWVKDRPGMGSFYRSQHELVLVFKHGNAPHANHFLLGQHGRTRTNVWRYPAARSGRAAHGDPSGQEAVHLHPTVKPVRLIEDALMDCSRRGEVVLDPFLGSGSTLIACDKAKRRCFGMEFSPRYVDTAVRRWELWTGREAIHEETGFTFTALGQKRGKDSENG